MRLSDRAVEFASILRDTRQKGLDTFAVGHLAENLKKRGADVISVADSYIPLGVPSEICEALREAANDERLRMDVAPIRGRLDLREAIAHNLRAEYGMRVDPVSEIVITAGSGNAIWLAMQSVVNAGDEVIIPVPNFTFDSRVKMTGGNCVYVPLREEDGFRCGAEDLEQAVTPRTKMIVLCSPNNPLGRVLTRDELEGIG